MRRYLVASLAVCCLLFSAACRAATYEGAKPREAESASSEIETASAADEETVTGAPSISIPRQPGGPMLRISHAVTPVPAWVVIRACGPKGRIGPVCGYTFLERGENEDVDICIDEHRLTRKVWVLVYEDGGKLGEFEPDERPVVVDGKQVVTQLSLR